MTKNTQCVLKALAAFIFALSAHEIFAQEMSARWIYGGAFYAYESRSLHRPADTVRELPITDGQALPAFLMKQADAVAKSPHRVTLSLIDKGQVVYRYQRDGVKDDSFVISYSMAKSLTSLMVGHALCAGHINDLNDKLGDYVPELANTVYGRSPIRHVLNMASGANAYGEQGEPYLNFSADLRSQKTSYQEALLRYSDAKQTLLGTVAPGDTFEYKNLDTAALAILVEKATQRPLHRWFEETLVSAAGLVRTTAWHLEKDNRPLAHGFFYASPDDWIRLALYSLDAYQGRAGGCMQSFMHQALTNGIPVYNNSEYTRYGYQFWTGMPDVNAEVFWMRGYGGQYIGVDPQKERVLVAASTKPEPSVLALFKSWLNSN